MAWNWLSFGTGAGIGFTACKIIDAKQKGDLKKKLDDRDSQIGHMDKLLKAQEERINIILDKLEGMDNDRNSKKKGEKKNDDSKK